MILLTGKQLQRIHHAERAGTPLNEFVKLYHVSRITLVTQLQAWRTQNRVTGAVGRMEFNAALDKAAPQLPKWISKYPCIPPAKVVEYS